MFIYGIFAMPVIGIDLGGTKLAGAVFSEDGVMREKTIMRLDGRTGDDVGGLVTCQIGELMRSSRGDIRSIGVSVPGISYSEKGTVWAPNIPGWTDYPLTDAIRSYLGDGAIDISIESDRACCILGETWLGAAAGCRNAVFLAVGTGIGAGILVDGVILRGASDIAGAIGWMALDRPYRDEYIPCGCFEYYASGDGIARTARMMLGGMPEYNGVLVGKAPEAVTARDVFAAFDKGDALAVRVFDRVIELWGMAAANCVSLFNPDIVIFGGGVFGPAVRFIDRIYKESCKWAQPISIRQVSFRASVLGDDAGLAGAGRLALDRAGMVQ